jgi:hypothetical protein
LQGAPAIDQASYHAVDLAFERFHRDLTAPSQAVYLSLLELCAMRGDADRAKSLLANMEAAHLATADAYLKAISAYGWAGDLLGMEVIAAQMVLAGITPTLAVCCWAVITGLFCFVDLVRNYTSGHHGAHLPPWTVARRGRRYESLFADAQGQAAPRRAAQPGSDPCVPR